MKIPQKPPTLEQITRRVVAAGSERVLQIVRARAEVLQGVRYLHWDTLRHLQPPDGLTLEEWWLATKGARQAAASWFPLRDRAGGEFSFVVTDAALATLHVIDRNAGGMLGSASEPITNPATRDYYLTSS